MSQVLSSATKVLTNSERYNIAARFLEIAKGSDPCDVLSPIQKLAYETAQHLIKEAMKRET